jgi:hypothetical protein
MRDQYAGDVSDVLKFAFLRALAGADRALGIARYYAPGDDVFAFLPGYSLGPRRGMQIFDIKSQANYLTS